MVESHQTLKHCHLLLILKCVGHFFVQVVEENVDQKSSHSEEMLPELNEDTVPVREMSGRRSIKVCITMKTILPQGNPL